MKLSTRSRYGVRFLIEIGLNQDKGSVQLNSIAQSQDISEKYLGQLVIQLKSAGIISSERGKNGGYRLVKEARLITLREVVEKLEGDLSLVDCVDETVDCNRQNICITRDVWKELSECMIDFLESVTIQDLVDKTVKARLKGNISYDI